MKTEKSFRKGAIMYRQLKDGSWRHYVRGRIRGREQTVAICDDKRSALEAWKEFGLARALSCFPPLSEDQVARLNIHAAERPVLEDSIKRVIRTYGNPLLRTDQDPKPEDENPIRRYRGIAVIQRKKGPGFKLTITKEDLAFCKTFDSLTLARQFQAEDKLKEALRQFPLAEKEVKEFKNIIATDETVAEVLKLILRCHSESPLSPSTREFRGSRGSAPPRPFL